MRWTCHLFDVTGRRTFVAAEEEGGHHDDRFEADYAGRELGEMCDRSHILSCFEADYVGRTGAFRGGRERS